MAAFKRRDQMRLSIFVVSIALLMFLPITLGAQGDCDGAKFFDFSVFSGPTSGPGYADGTGAAANFYMPSGVAVDGEGTIWVADTANHVIRKITPDGVVMTHAGVPGVPGSNDGKTHEARFNSPRGIYVDSVGLIYVADFGNHTIRRIDDELNVVTVGGVPGVAGEVDGPFGTALFNGPTGIIADTPDIVVTDALGHTIRYISLGGEVQTVGGQPNTPGHRDGLFDSSLFNTPTGIAVDLSGNVWIADSGNHVIRGIAVAQGLVFTAAGSAGETGSQDGTGAAARFDTPIAVAADLAGHVYVLDSGNFTVRQGTVVGAALDIETVAGAPEVSGYVDAQEGSDARFEMPMDLAAALSGETFVAERSAGTIRRIETTGAVSTIAGTRRQTGSTDGPPDVATFDRPGGAAVDTSGNVWVADRTTHVLRRIAPDGSVTTFAGMEGASGAADGVGSAARFNSPSGVAVCACGNVFVADTGNHSIRKVTPAGVVSTLAGLSGTPGSSDGTGSAARFMSPQQLAIDAQNTLFVTDGGNSTVRRVSSAGVVTTIAGMAGVAGDADGTGANARLRFPVGIALGQDGTLHVSDREAHTIRRITTGGSVTTVAGKAGESGTTGGDGSDARFNSPAGLAMDSSGNLWIADMNNHVVRRLSSTGSVTTVGGSAWLGGTADGLGSEARFSEPISVAIGANDELAVVSNLNGVVHKGEPVTPLCLDSRFAISLQATDPRTEGRGLGLAIPQTDLFGYFAIPGLTSNPGNPEVFVKLLDGRVENGSFWVFYGGLTDFQYELLVTDSTEGSNRTYRKAGGSFCGGADTSAFAGKELSSSGVRMVMFDLGDTSSLTSAGEAECGVDALCLFSNRFSLTLEAKDPRTEATGSGLPIPQTDLFGYFSIPDLTNNPGNPEVFVKLLDGRVENGSFWVFYGGLTDFELTLTVTDTEMQLSKTYTKDGGSYCGGADTGAFQ